MRRKCANLATVGATAATDTMRRSMFREIHATDEAVDGDADSPTDGAVVACLMFPSMQRSMFRARIPAEAERKPRAKQEKTPAAYCKGVTNLMTPTLGGSQNITPTSVSKSERSPRNTQKTAAPAAKHTKRHFNKKIEKILQKICTIKKRLPPLQRQKNKGIRQKYCAVFPPCVLP